MNKHLERIILGILGFVAIAILFALVAATLIGGIAFIIHLTGGRELDPVEKVCSYVAPFGLLACVYGLGKDIQKH